MKIAIPIYIQLLLQVVESLPEELDTGIPIWNIILILSGIVLIILIILLFTYKQKK